MTNEEVQAVLDKIRPALQADGGDVFVYFKHEEAGKGPEFARHLIRLLGED